MKKLVISIFLVLLLIIIFFQFQNYRRLNPPDAYEYKINKEVDVNYHNPTFVKDYYKGAYEIGTFARELWYNNRIDVLFSNHKSEQSVNATKVFNSMKIKVVEIENILLNSAKLKKQGFSNHEIQEMEISGMGPGEFMLNKYFETTTLKIGDNNQAVLEMQKILRNKGYFLRVDGIFDIETKSAVQQFQKKNGIYSSGIVDKRTLIQLMKGN